MKFYDSNLELLKKGNLNLIDKLLENDESNGDGHIIEIFSDNSISIKIKNHENNYIELLSGYNIKKQFDNIIKYQYEKANREIVLVFGLLNGEHIKKLKKQISKKSIIIVIDNNIELIKDILKIYRLEDIIDTKGIIYIFENNIEKINNYISKIMNLFQFNLNKIGNICFPYYDKNYIDFCNNIISFAERERERFLFELGNDVEDTLIGIQNRFDNIIKYASSPGLNDLISIYGNEYKNVPAIIVASGPSLNKNINDLKKAKGKALILACDGSMTALLKNNIVPDCVGSVERIMLTYEAFYKNKRFPDEVVLTAPAVIRKEIVDNFDTKVLSFFKDESYGNMFNRMVLDKGIVWSGASVAHMLVGLAHKLECSPIILIGQDLAYGDDGNSHVSGAEVNIKKKLENVDVFVTGKTGKKLPSTDIWRLFLEIYEDFIINNDIKIIDATEGGALIKGTIIRDLKSTINEYCIKKVKPLRESVDSIEISDIQREKILQNIIDVANRELEYLKNLIGNLYKAQNRNSKSESFTRSNFNQVQLDYIYDSIESCEDIVKDMIKGNHSIFYQFLIYRANNKISTLKEDRFTINSLKANLSIQRELIDDCIYYTEKIIDLFEDNINKINTNKLKD